jgi:hypothetical protein
MELMQIHFSFSDPPQSNESQNTLDHFDEFLFEAGTGITKFLGKFAQEQGLVA